MKIVISPFDVLPLDQNVNARFDGWNLWREARAKLLENFCDQLLMCERLSHFEYSNNGGLKPLLSVHIRIIIYVLLF